MTNQTYLDRMDAGGETQGQRLIEADRSKRIAALEARHEEAMSKYDKTKESYHEGYADALDVAIQIISGELC